MSVDSTFLLQSGTFMPPNASTHALPSAHQPTHSATGCIAIWSLRNTLRLHEETELRKLASGLLARQAELPPKLFYDALGSTLYQAITLTPEYYPTRTEQAILDQHEAAIAAQMGPVDWLVDLGSGDSVKAERWLDQLKPNVYLAVDISESALVSALRRLSGRLHPPRLQGLVCDFSQSLDLGTETGPHAMNFLYPGSSIGNFTPDAALAFLRRIRAHCDHPGSGLLIGVDTVKDEARLIRAYDDPLGVTAAFNRNILLHVNRLLGTKFDIEQWAHEARYDHRLQRIEMHLRCLKAHEIDIRGQRRSFRRGETIHTENSYKYTRAGFTRLLQEAGFGFQQVWSDAAEDFLVFYARP